jgi:hypothetical protein
LALSIFEQPHTLMVLIISTIPSLYSNPSIEPHHGYLTSRRMEDQNL